MPTLFVYGTLKRGQCRSSFLRGYRFLGYAVSEPRYALIDLGPYPALLRSGESCVRGELYEVDMACLARLDVVEAVSDGLYERGVISLAVVPQDLSGESSAITYFYLRDVAGFPLAGESWP